MATSWVKFLEVFKSIWLAQICPLFSYEITQSGWKQSHPWGEFSKSNGLLEAPRPNLLAWCWSTFSHWWQSKRVTVFARFLLLLLLLAAIALAMSASAIYFTCSFAFTFLILKWACLKLEFGRLAAAPGSGSPAAGRRRPFPRALLLLTTEWSFQCATKPRGLPTTHNKTAHIWTGLWFDLFVSHIPALNFWQT